MAFKEVVSLDSDVTVALGGINKQTGKPNPKQIEGFYLGSKEVESKKAKSGKAYIHIFQTAKGNIGVWGKTDLDRKMQSASPGAMTRVTQSGMQPTPNGEMYKYKVEIDLENSIEVDTVAASSRQEEAQVDAGPASYDSDDLGAEETDLDAADEQEQVDAAPPARPQAPRQPARTPDAARQDKVKSLLAGRR